MLKALNPSYHTKAEIKEWEYYPEKSITQACKTMKKIYQYYPKISQ